MSTSTLLQFTPLSTTIPPSFWHALTTHKLDHLRLNEDSIDIKASYTIGRVIKDRSRIKGRGEETEEVRLPASLVLHEESGWTSEGEEVEKTHDHGVPAATSSSSPSEQLQTSTSSHPSSRLTVSVRGTLRNYNTAPQFTSADKNQIFNDLALEILNDLRTSSEPLEAIVRFTILAFADLKKYKFYHWAALPALVAQPNWRTASNGWKSLRETWPIPLDGSTEGEGGRASFVETLTAEFKKHTDRYRGTSEAGFCLVKRDGDSCKIGRVVDYQNFFAGVEDDKRIVLFIDPSSIPFVPGWPLRNLLALLSIRFQLKKICVICWRDDLDNGTPAERSMIGSVYLPGEEVDSASRLKYGKETLPLTALSSDLTRSAAIGWERNNQGKLAPKVADLGPLMDPRRLADQAVDLNLKLMRWRIMPQIQLEKIAATKCLLLGAGTLGCYVARILMGWGIRNITLVDSSRVSYSNPVRQPLFEFVDCLEGGKPKAECAAESLRRIFPGVHAKGIQLAVPMPGHGHFSSSSAASSKVEASAKRDAEQLEDLISSHDAVFLLMDSRESRWLPTMMCAAKNKIVINAALGFDTYLVMRHGAGPAPPPSDVADGAAEDVARARLGCYFCNDVVAPTDSLTDRTLDQMCTVTRPGLAAMAGASAVELLVSLVQHPDGVAAPAPTPTAPHLSSTLRGNHDQKVDPTTTSDTNAQGASSCLGLLPHQLRANLSNFNTLSLTSPAYARCTACSSIVVETYRSKGWRMLRRALGAEGDDFSDEEDDDDDDDGDGREQRNRGGGAAYLQRLTGLDLMYAETERMLEAQGGVEEWSDDEGDGDEDGEGELI